MFDVEAKGRRMLDAILANNSLIELFALGLLFVAVILATLVILGALVMTGTKSEGSNE